MPITRLSTGRRPLWRQVHQTLLQSMVHVNDHAFRYCLLMLTAFFVVAAGVGR